jgi:hypothetical protein
MEMTQRRPLLGNTGNTVNKLCDAVARAYNVCFDKPEAVQLRTLERLAREACDSGDLFKLKEFLNPFVVPKLGATYHLVGFSDKYILTLVSNNQVCLINLRTGNRCMNPVVCNNAQSISKYEWDCITNGRSFELFKEAK